MQSQPAGVLSYIVECLWVGGFLVLEEVACFCGEFEMGGRMCHCMYRWLVLSVAEREGGIYWIRQGFYCRSSWWGSGRSTHPGPSIYTGLTSKRDLYIHPWIWALLVHGKQVNYWYHNTFSCLSVDILSQIIASCPATPIQSQSIQTTADGYSTKPSPQSSPLKRTQRSQDPSISRQHLICTLDA
jgi:hypothetical protein